MEGWRVEIMAPSTEGAYSDLISTASGASLYHTLIWRDILLDMKIGDPVYWIACQGDRSLAALPAFVRRSEQGAVLNSLPFMQGTGGVICDARLDRAARDELQRSLIAAMLDWCRACNIDIACIIGSAFTGYGDSIAIPAPPDFHMDRTIRVIDLAQPLDFRPSVLGAVRKAQRARPVMREAASPAEARLVYDIYSGNMRRIGVIPVDWRFYEALFTRAHRMGHASFVWVEAGGEPVAGLVITRHGDTADYYSAGSTASGRRIQAGNWLCDRQIRLAKAAGLKWWNWMASPNRQVYDFKKRWGGADRTYPIRVWRLGNVDAWLKLSPQELSGHFPGYFVMPYDWLLSRETVS